LSWQVARPALLLDQLTSVHCSCGGWRAVRLRAVPRAARAVKALGVLVLLVQMLLCWYCVLGASWLCCCAAVCMGCKWVVQVQLRAVGAACAEWVRCL